MREKELGKEDSVEGNLGLFADVDSPSRRV